MILKQTGPGTVDNETSSPNRPLMDSAGTSMHPIQAEGDGATTFKVLAKATSEAPWREIIAPGTASFIQSIAWVPYLRLQVTGGAGSVTLYVGEK